eukprot:3224491-Rhodomonas_salina.2
MYTASFWQHHITPPLLQYHGGKTLMCTAAKDARDRRGSRVKIPCSDRKKPPPMPPQPGGIRWSRLGNTGHVTG